MRTEKISLRNFLSKLLAREGLDADTRRDVNRAMAEPDVLVAWGRTLELLEALRGAGRLKWLGLVERDGEKLIRFLDLASGDVISLREPPTVKAQVVPFLPKGFVKSEESGKIEAILTSVATCRSEDELGGVMKRMLATIREMVSADYCIMHFSDESVRTVFESIGEGAPETSGRFAPALADRWVRDDGFCLHVPDLRRAPELRQYSEDGRFSSVVVLPLRCKGKTYGVLEAWSRAVSHFSADDVGFLALLALLAAGMIKNAEYLETLIFRDPLTHVYNRGFLEDQLQREIERYKRTSEPVSFLLVDVDNFKQVNTRFGHPVGDVVLSAIGQLLEDKVRQVDVVARYGGDEFGIILPDTIGEHAYMTAERLRNVVELNDFAASTAALGDMKITISVGGAICPFDALTKETLIETADRALAEAERGGKNRVVFAGLPPAGTGPR